MKRRFPIASLQMAVDKLGEGVEAFAADQRKLEALLAEVASGKKK